MCRLPCLSRCAKRATDSCARACPRWCRASAAALLSHPRGLGLRDQSRPPALVFRSCKRCKLLAELKHGHTRPAAKRVRTLQGLCAARPCLGGCARALRSSGSSKEPHAAHTRSQARRAAHQAHQAGYARLPAAQSPADDPRSALIRSCHCGAQRVSGAAEIELPASIAAAREQSQPTIYGTMARLQVGTDAHDFYARPPICKLTVPVFPGQPSHASTALCAPAPAASQQ